MIQKNSRILILIPNLGRGGAQKVFLDQFKFYADHYPTIGCVFNWDDTFEDDRLPNLISLNVPAGNNWISKSFFFLKRVYELRRIKRENNINFSISHLEGADYVNLLSKRKEKIICWIHGTKTSDENIMGVLGLLRKKIFIPFTYRLSDKIVTVSEGIHQELIKNFKISSAKISTIYNSFNLDDIFTKAGQTLQVQIQELFDSKTILITHCRLSRQKNLFILIDLFIAARIQADLKLMILGDGELKEALLQYCDTNSLRVYSVWDSNASFNPNYDIYFMGYERNPYPYLRRATLYVMTSSWEGFPLSLCEAMASGVPVISSDCYTGPREIISPGLNAEPPIRHPLSAPYGVLMPLANEDTIKVWAETIISLTKNMDLRNQLVTSGKQRVLAFDRKKISSQWLKLVDELEK